MYFQKNTFSITGQCLLPGGVVALQTVVIDLSSGLIDEIKAPRKNYDLYLPDCLVLPGLIDRHVHGREDVTGRETYKEDFSTLGLAALNGGVVHVGEMGNNPVPPIDDKTYRDKEDLTRKSPVPVTLYAMMGPDTRPLSFPVPYKLCHARTTGANDTIFFPNCTLIEKTAERYAGQVVSHHAEDADILQSHANEPTHERRRPPEAEASAVAYALDLTKRYKLKSTICHCSVCSGIEAIVTARMQGVAVTCEVTPHHLYFDDSMITAENRSRMQMNPPLRSPADRKYCIEALRRGEIDVLASDHAPHTDEDRAERKTSGFPHLDTLGAFLTWLMVEHKFTPSDIGRICCARPAAFLNQFLSPERYGRGYGRIAPGFMGSLTVLNLHRPVTVTKKKLKTKCRWSPFEGVTFPGSVECTIIRGVVHIPTMR